MLPRWAGPGARVGSVCWWQVGVREKGGWQRKEALSPSVALTGPLEGLACLLRCSLASREMPGPAGGGASLGERSERTVMGERSELRPGGPFRFREGAICHQGQWLLPCRSRDRLSCAPGVLTVMSQGPRD